MCDYRDCDSVSGFAYVHTVFDGEERAGMWRLPFWNLVRAFLDLDHLLVRKQAVVVHQTQRELLVAMLTLQRLFNFAKRDRYLYLAVASLGSAADMQRKRQQPRPKTGRRCKRSTWQTNDAWYISGMIPDVRVTMPLMEIKVSISDGFRSLMAFPSRRLWASTLTSTSQAQNQSKQALALDDKELNGDRTLVIA